MREFLYNKKDGTLLSKKSKNAPFKEVGYFNSGKRYLEVKIDYKHVKVHQIIWKMHYGEIPKGKIIDHIDGNKINNRIENLRLVTPSQNAIHTKNLNRNNTSGYKGVVFDEKKRVYTMQIVFNGKQYRKRGFKTAEDAAISYNEYAKNFFGDYAYLNKVEK